MKHIGIITIYNVNNYGAELQAFALHHKLKKLGHDNEIINYLYYKNPKYITEKASSPVIKAPLKNKLRDVALKLIEKYSQVTNPGIAKTRRSRFKEFYAKHVSLSKEYRSYSQLHQANHPYTHFIVGSDQVWNPGNGTNISPYFLSFAPKGANTISYASSFGVGSISQSHYPVYNNLIANIRHLATREYDGVNIIREISGREAVQVVDPTLLLSREEWMDLAKPFAHEEPYILIFVFKDSKYATDLALSIQAKTGYKIVRICKNEMKVDSDDNILNLRDLGPLEFLGVYQKASFVITSSFHGTVFSLIFEKPFYTIAPASKDNNSRQAGLLSMMGLSQRLLKEGEAIENPFDVHIDFGKVKRIIDKEREKSLSFLLNALS